MHETLALFLIYLNEEGVSHNTKQAYERDIRQLLAWLESRGIRRLHETGSAELAMYIDALEEAGTPPSTISRKAAAIRKFFSYAAANGCCYINPAASLKSPKVIRRLPAIPGEEEIRLLLSQPDPATPKGRRDRAILELITAAGLSVTELTSLRSEDVDLKDGVLKTGGSGRKVSFRRQTADHLQNYAEVRRELLGSRPDNGFFFLSYTGAPLTRQGVWKIIRGYGAAAGFAEITPQILRHCFAVSALRQGKDVSSLQKLLGHSSRAGSLEYQHLVRAELS